MDVTYDLAADVMCMEEVLVTLEGAVIGSLLVGVTRSMEREVKEVLCGFVRGGNGLVSGVYGVDVLMDEGGV